MVSRAGLEPARETHTPLKRARLPIPPPRRTHDLKTGRNAGIRTLDLTLPKRARYQAALHSAIGAVERT
jgi:hypothetical protein